LYIIAVKRTRQRNLNGDSEAHGLVN
jgi:hypothetical protein